MFDICNLKKKDSKRVNSISFKLILLLAFLFVATVLITGCSENLNQVKLTTSLKDSAITNGKTTQLNIIIENKGTENLKGEFEVVSDDSDYVKINYPSKEKLSFDLAPEENVKRVIDVTGTTKAIRTDYELTINIIDANQTIIDVSKVILTVKKK